MPDTVTTPTLTHCDGCGAPVDLVAGDTCARCVAHGELRDWWRHGDAEGWGDEGGGLWFYDEPGGDDADEPV